MSRSEGQVSGRLGWGGWFRGRGWRVGAPQSAKEKRCADREGPPPSHPHTQLNPLNASGPRTLACQCQGLSLSRRPSPCAFVVVGHVGGVAAAHPAARSSQAQWHDDDTPTSSQTLAELQTMTTWLVMLTSSALLLPPSLRPSLTPSVALPLRACSVSVSPCLLLRATFHTSSGLHLQPNSRHRECFCVHSIMCPSSLYFPSL